MLIKVLEHKWVIRFFGIMLILAPFLNAALALSQIQGIPDPWSMVVLTKYISVSSKAFLFLQGASAFIGVLMLNGSTKAWRYTLVLLSGHVMLMLSQWQSFKTDRTPLFLIFVDICIFLFIADQLVWKVSTPKKKSTAVGPSTPPVPTFTESTPLEAKTVPIIKVADKPTVVVPIQPPKIISSKHKRIIIHFDGIGPWAQLKEVSNQGLRVRCLVNDPPKLDSRKIEINLARDLTLNVRFIKRDESDFYFEYINISGSEIGRLNQWLKTAS